MKVFFVMLLLHLSLFASQILWHSDYKSAFEKAQQSNKMVLLFLTSQDCTFCKKLMETTFQEIKVIERVNKEYISVHLDKDLDTYPATFATKAVPKIFFLNAKEEIVDYSLGYWDATDFLFTLDDVQKRIQKKEKK